MSADCGGRPAGEWTGDQHCLTRRRGRWRGKRNGRTTATAAHVPVRWIEGWTRHHHHHTRLLAASYCCCLPPARNGRRTIRISDPLHGYNALQRHICRFNTAAAALDAFDWVLSYLTDLLRTHALTLHHVNAKWALQPKPLSIEI